MHHICMVFWVGSNRRILLNKLERMLIVEFNQDPVMTRAAFQVSQNALNLAFTNNAADQADRVVANGFAVTAETVGWL